MLSFKTSPSAPRKIIIGSKNNNPTIVIINPINIIQKTDVPKICLASSFSFCPSFIAISAEPPTPKSIPIAILLHITGHKIFIAASPVSPTPLPINIPSTIMYTEFTKTPIIAGITNFKNKLPILFVDKLFSILPLRLS